MTIGSMFAHSETTRVVMPKKMFTVLFAFVLAVSMVPGIAWAAGDDSASNDAEATSESGYVQATCEVIGLDQNGDPQVWASKMSYILDEGATAATITEEAFEFNELSADYDPNGTYGWYLNSITSPYDNSQTLEYNDSTGQYWQLFYNGEASDLGASSIVLESGDAVVWYYSVYGDDLAALDEPGALSRYEGVGNVAVNNDSDESGSFEIGPLFIVFIVLIVIAFICLAVLIRMLFTRRGKKQAEQEQAAQEQAEQEKSAQDQTEQKQIAQDQTEAALGTPKAEDDQSSNSSSADNSDSDSLPADDQDK